MAEAERAAPTTASKSARAPPPDPHPSTTSSIPTSSPAATTTTADGRPIPRAGEGDPPEDHAAGRPVPQDESNDPPEDQPSSSTPTPESEPRESSTGADLPATNDARQSAVDQFSL